jgi:predicted nucleotidyltransferase
MAALSSTQSHLRYPLTSILGSAGNVRVLRALIADRAPQSATRLAQVAGLTPQGVRLVLDSLAQQRLALVHGSGRVQLHALNLSHPFAAALVALFEQEQHRWEEVLASLRDVLAQCGAAVSAAWLYGSVARGLDSSESDLDLAILVRSQTVTEQLRADLMPLEDAQHLRISLTALTSRELAALPDGDRWWSDVVRDARVLKGAAPEQAKRRLLKAA